jgi:beta-phosphoglucomutase family hydrolase
MLGLPEHITACLFDLDGVLTPTAAVHDQAWRETFDAYLRERAERDGTAFVPFDPGADYETYVDGKPRADGVRDFLASRGIRLADGDPDDPPDKQTVHGIGNRKNRRLLELIKAGGVQAYEGSRRYLEATRDAGLRRAVVSASANCRDVLISAGIDDLLEVRVDGIVAAAQHLKGKPSPDTFLAAATQLGVPPEQACVFEDALAGVAAGKAGGFGFVVGVDRLDDRHALDLRAHGATIVVSDLAELL